MKKLILLSLLLIGFLSNAQPILLKQLEKSISNGSVVITANGTGTLTGVATYTPTLPLSMITGTNTLLPTTTSLTINGVTKTFTGTPSFTVGDLFSTSSYTNPSWLASLTWNKITSTPTTISGYGITNPLMQGTLTANYIPKAVSGQSVTNSIILQSNTDNILVNDIKIGKGKSVWSTNTGIGVNTLDSVTSGTDNTAFGFCAGRYTTTGTFITAFGKRALEANTTGNDNIAMGAGALLNNTTGNSNLAFGTHSQKETQTTTNNISIGMDALSNNISGNNNVGIGNSSLYLNQGSNHVAIGQDAMLQNTTGNSDVSIGMQSSYSNVDGTYNSVAGMQAFYSNVHGNYNTIFGAAAGASVLGDKNVMIGFQSGANEVGSNKLYIDVSNTSTPLIGGDFSTRSLTKNGNEIATTNQLPVLTASTNITIAGSAPNYTISTPTQTTGLIGLSNLSATSPINYNNSTGVFTLTPLTSLGTVTTGIWNGTAIANSYLANGAVANLSGTNTGDNATNTQYSGLVTNANHTGDATGATALTLATVNSNVGLFGNTASSLSITVNGKGLVTAVGSNSIVIAESQVTNLTADLLAKQNTLVAGSNITLSTNTISVSNAPTFTTTTLLGVTTQSNTNYTGVQNLAKGADAASSSTVDLSSVTGNYIHVTGNTTINNFGIVQAGSRRTLVFDAAPILTNSANLILPDAYNIQTAANDIAEVVSDGSGVWRLLNYRLYSNTSYTYSTSFTGFSANPTAVTARYTVNGKIVTVYWSMTAGTSNATTFTMTLPLTAANTTEQYSASSSARDNGAATTTFIRTRVNSNVADLYKVTVGGAWTGSGTKGVTSSFVYEIQ